MAVRPIRITGSNTITGDLTLQDNNGNSATVIKVDVGDSIQWIVSPGWGVQKITGLPPKSGSPNVFESGDPKPVGASANWKGTIKSGTNRQVEKYDIKWTDTAGKTYTYDPRISVNP